MKVLKIVCHDKTEYFCKTRDELRVFLQNYKRIEGKRIKKMFSDKIFWVDHIEVIEMTEEEFNKIPATIESWKYFDHKGIDGRT